MRTPPNALEKQLARFLKERRGEQTYTAFAKTVGLPPTTLFRLENQESSATLKAVGKILDKLDASLSDIFRDI
jgi:DNA-binding XRE family transcriptional regulator